MDEEGGQDHGCTPKIRKVCPLKSTAGEEVGMEKMISNGI